MRGSKTGAHIAIALAPVRWHGGKFLMSRQIMPYLPAHRLYTEAFGGGAGVLLHKPRSHAEIYNDLDDDIVGLFRVLQDPAQACRLIELLRLTPFARREFEIAYEPSTIPIERARRLVIRSFMGFGSNAHSATQRGHNRPASAPTPTAAAPRRRRTGRICRMPMARSSSACAAS
jgi:DNA adenine methylase